MADEKTEWEQRCGFCNRMVDGVAPEQTFEQHIEGCGPAKLTWLTAKHLWEHTQGGSQ